MQKRRLNSRTHSSCTTILHDTTLCSSPNQQAAGSRQQAAGRRQKAAGSRQLQASSQQQPMSCSLCKLAAKSNQYPAAYSQLWAGVTSAPTTHAACNSRQRAWLAVPKAVGVHDAKPVQAMRGQVHGLARLRHAAEYDHVVAGTPGVLRQVGQAGHRRGAHPTAGHKRGGAQLSACATVGSGMRGRGACQGEGCGRRHRLVHARRQQQHTHTRVHGRAGGEG